jgi:hypothetical protein
MNPRALIILAVIVIAIAGFYYAVFSTHMDPEHAPGNVQNSAPATQ